MRKNIDIPNDSVKVLKWLALMDGRTTKNYIERILIGHANDFEEAFKKESKSNKPVKK